MLMLLSSCSKEDNIPNKQNFHTLTYEVIVGDNKSWSGGFVNEVSAGVTIYDYAPAPNYWKISFIPANQDHFIMSVSVMPKMEQGDFNYPQITINFYVNDKLIKTTTVNNSLFAGLQYVLN